MNIVYIVSGAILGAALFQDFQFFILGGLLGYLFWRITQLTTKIGELDRLLAKVQGQKTTKPISSLEARLDQVVPRYKPEREPLNHQQAEQSRPLVTNKSHSEKTNTSSFTKNTVSDSVEQAPQASIVAPTPTPQKTTSIGDKAPVIDRQPIEPPQPDIVTKVLQSIIGYFTQGNIVVRVGVVILFFGVAFLLKYAAENSIISLELRLTGVALGAIGLMIFGWKLKDKKQDYALILQGAAIGILYLTLFSSFRLYGLVPSAMAFPLLIVFSGLAMMLAVLQNSRALAVLAIAGGFLAPILISTGSGNHVALFGYYAILNIAIFSVAWFKSWRLLNLIGFVFTFLIGTAWGVTKYQPADFATTEPFLLLFFLLYASVAILFAIKQKPDLKGYVDSTLIFGLPLIAFSLQAAMVIDFEYGLAWSAFGIGTFYLICAFALLKLASEKLHLLAEVFVALGIIFTSLVVPFALDGEWTAATWAIEGAGLIWIGLRQNRWFAKYFGALIQFAGGVIFLSDFQFNWQESFTLDAQLLGIIFVATSALFVSYQIWLRRAELSLVESKSRFLFIVWGLIWWYLGGVSQISHFLASKTELHALILFFTLSSLLWHSLESKLKWTMMSNLVWVTLVLSLLNALVYINSYQHLIIGFGSFYWLLAIIAFYGVLYRQDQYEQNEQKSFRFEPSVLHLTTLLLIITVSLIELNWLMRELHLSQTSWAISLIAVLGCFWLLIIGNTKGWPCKHYPQAYTRFGLNIIMLALALWSLLINFPHHGMPNPLVYLPLINPLDIVQGLVVIMLFKTYKIQQIQGVAFNKKDNSFGELEKILAGAFCFIWLNVILLRCIHAWTGVPYELSTLFQSFVVQTSLSIFWTVLGLIGTIWATRRLSRRLWVYAASLLGVVVLKLFVIDLANSSSIERIISFVVVGLLLLVVGYFSPMPPKQLEQTST